MTSSLSLRSVQVGTTSAAVEWCATRAVRPSILEISVIQLTAVASQFGIGRPQAVGITPVYNLFQNDDTGFPSSVIAGSLTWSVSPTVPLIYLRRVNLTLASVGVVFTFPRGLIIPVSGSLVLWNIAANAVVDTNCIADE